MRENLIIFIYIRRIQTVESALLSIVYKKLLLFMIPRKKLQKLMYNYFRKDSRKIN